MADLTRLNVEELNGKLKAVKSVQTTCTVIFAIIILAWIVLGFWKTNLPVFISTVAMACILVLTNNLSRAAITAEIAKRNRAGTESEAS